MREISKYHHLHHGDNKNTSKNVFYKNKSYKVMLRLKPALQRPLK